MKFMSNDGKYQKGAKPAKRKSYAQKSLLQTYLTSLLSLVLCVTMFLSTTAAWFTDSIETTGNQIMVGTLNVELYHASFKGGVLGEYTQIKNKADLELNEKQHQILSSDIIWEPGYTAIEQFKIVEAEDNNLAFTYEMTLGSDALNKAIETYAAVPASDEVTTLTDEQLKVWQYIQIAKEITVWSFTGVELDLKEYDSFDDLVAAKDDTGSVWQKVGTLYEVMTEHLPVFENVMTTADGDKQNPGCKVQTIALHMNDDYAEKKEGPSIQGAILDDICITLLATQISSGNDAFSTPANSKDVQIHDIESVTNQDGVVSDENGVTLMDIDYGSAVKKARVTVPAGVKLQDAKTNALKFTIKEPETPVTETKGQNVLALNISIDGIASDNTVVIPVILELNPGLTNLSVVHGDVLLKKLDKLPASDAADLDQSFHYDAETGILTIYTKSFSPFQIYYGTVASNDEKTVANALAEGHGVRLTGDMTLEQNLVVEKGGVLNGNGKTVKPVSDIENSYDCLITTTGGVIKNVTVAGGYSQSENKLKIRAIGTGSSGKYQLSSDLLIDNVNIDDVQYALNGSGTGKETVTVRNSLINGWCSFANLTQLSFENCTLGSGDSYLGYMVIYGNTSFTNCHFETVVEKELDRNFWLGTNSETTYNKNTVIEFVNCTYGNQTVTAENFRDLFCMAGDKECFDGLKACTINVSYTNSEGKVITGTVVWPTDNQTTN